jgi:hypothetical protein
MQVLKGKSLLIFSLSVLGIFIIILIYLLFKNFLLAPKNQLTIYTLQPMGGTVAEGVHLIVTNSSGQVIAEKTTNASGVAVFHLINGNYTVTADGGYTGKNNFSLNDELVLEMKVLSISH